MYLSRRETLENLADRPLDVLIIGGGIVGAGVARDAALRGLRVALVEQYDFASGTSSRSSRLLHGGLRYLAQGRLGLVYQASREKRILQRIAPHLVDPLAFVFPTYHGGPWTRWKLRVGVKAYDLLAGGKNFEPSSALNVEQTVQMLPAIQQHQLSGAVRYYDAFTNDARLVIDTLRSAAAHGAMPINYVRCENVRHRGHLWDCYLHDTVDDRRLDVSARCVVNAAGPWGDRLPPSKLKLRLTKGVHLVIDRERLPIPDAVVMSEHRRILFAIPWGRRVILGTTDTDYSGAPEAVRTEPRDVSYILHVINENFPGARICEGDVLSDWAGVRALIADDEVPHPSDVSREHLIRLGDDGWMDVAGGKLTTYRLIAEQAVDRLVSFLGEPRPSSHSGEKLLLPPQAVEAVSGVLPPVPSRELVEHFCRDEWAVHLGDVMLRRTNWRHYLHDADSVAQDVAEWMSQTLGWGASATARELHSHFPEGEPVARPA